MKLPFPFKSKEITPEMSSSPAAAWPWPTCATPKTVSFRSADVLKTMNAAYAAPESEVDDEYDEEEDAAVESVIRGLRSERLFFEPGETSSILEEAKLPEALSESESPPPLSESVAVAVDSRDPFVDFRASMEEMVEAHGIKDWAAMEELLTCYLKVNGKSNHGYIVGAFVDLLVSLATRNIIDPPSDGGDQAAPPTCSASSLSRSFTSPFSFSSSATTSSSTMISPSLSLVEVDDETEKSSVSYSSNHISIVPSNSN